MQPNILVMLSFYWPGNDAVGPNQSIRALAAELSDEFDFSVMTLVPPSREAPTGWVDQGHVRVRYFRRGKFGAKGLRQALIETPHDLVWLNSNFDRNFSLPALAMRRFGLTPPKPMLMSPRGEFAPGALAVKPFRKRAYFALGRALDLWRGVVLHATGEAEAKDIAAWDRGAHEMRIASNLRGAVGGAFVPGDGPLRVTFVGRIAPIKNLHLAFEALAGVRAPVRFSVVGPREDVGYWRRCEPAMAALPPNVTVDLVGELDMDGVTAKLAETDMFLLPTGGENFGHAIFEALSCGAPALISDRTPWCGLAAARAGWDLPLDDVSAFSRAIDAFAALPDEERAKWRAGARAKAADFMRASGAEEKSRALLREMVARGAGASHAA